MIGLDTTAIIDLFREDLNLKEILEKIDEPLVTTELNYIELVFGIDHENKRAQLEEEYYDEFFNSILSFNITRQVSKKASQIFWNLKKIGRTIEQIDCVIAGILLTNGVQKIITRNKKHFENIKGLEVISY